ncbi:MAG: DNA-processing protein DprA [Pseudorhodoplanes sp.]|uniref:DNA-processing protein DprA n=1 Tax=Pseudorhodoplanes sp. TaxID=1934341 RepID=UPI003D0F1F91
MTAPTETGAITKATLLLTSRFNQSTAGPRPLSPSEYHNLAQWLDTRGASLADLLKPNARITLRAYVGADRLLALLSRLADAERLIGHCGALGIWALGEREAAFPARLRQRLKTACLPLLFGAGRPEALDQGGICIVGSRDSADEAQDFARATGTRAGSEGLVVISSDMRGIDREAVSAALAAGGRAICVLSDSLEKAVISKRYRDALSANRITLATPFTPDTRFTVANAMRANRYQYGLSDAAIIVETRQTGGIWSGADENRKHGWVPAFVRAGVGTSSGNNALLHLGLLPITRHNVEKSPSLTHFLLERATSQPPLHADMSELPAPSPSISAQIDLYSIFLSELDNVGESIGYAEHAVAAYFGIEPLQARVWLTRARRERRIPTEAVPETVKSDSY